MSKKILVLFFILICLMPAMSLMRSGYFPMHDDMQAMRIHQMTLCFKDWQIPCRWVPDMGYGYGYPQFNYYPPLPYYVMTLIHLVGVSIIDSVKIGFILTFIISGIGMYLLGNKLWGKYGGGLSTLFYLYAPYRAVNVYDRGAMGEIWAMAFFPWVIWSMERIWQRNKPIDIVLLSVSVSALMTSHLLSTLMVAPLLMVWWLVRTFQHRKNLTQNLISFVISGLLSLGLSAYYVLPSLIEKPYAHLETLTMGYFNYLAHFATLKQLITNTHWGYGSSLLGPHDDMSLSIGIWHITIAIIAWVVITIKFNKSKQYIWVNILLIAGLGYLFLAHSKSTFIWKSIPMLEWLQFPWRFLAPASFVFSLVAGAILYFPSRKNSKVKIYEIILIICSPLIFLNISYMRPSSWFPMTDHIKLSGEAWRKQQTISIFDYLPIDAKLPPAERAPDKPWFATGVGEIINYSKGSNWQKIELNSSTKNIVSVPLFYYPGWQVRVNDQIVPINKGNELGLITFEVNPGFSQVLINLVNTPIRLISNGITLISILITTWLITRSFKYEN